MHIMPLMVMPVNRSSYESQVELLSNMKARAVVVESSQCLRMSYEVQTAAGKFFLGPAALSDEISRASSGITCSRAKCLPFNDFQGNFNFTVASIRLPFERSPSERVPDYVPEKPNIILFGDYQLAQCTAFGAYHFETTMILQGRECIACCARRALAGQNPNQQVIVSHLTAEDIEYLIGRPGALLLEDHPTH